MNWKKTVLITIILGLCVNLFADMIWHYLPDREVHPKTYVVVTIAIVFVCILLLMFGSESSTQSFLTRLWQQGFLATLWQKIIPRKTITFILNTEGGTQEHWNNAELHGEPVMSIHSLWYVTNLTNEDIWILRAYLEKTRTDGIIEFPDRRYLLEADTSIRPKRPTKISVDFCIRPPTCKEGEIFKGKIVFIDHFNKQHKVKVTFMPPIQAVETEDDKIPF